MRHLMEKERITTTKTQEIGIPADTYIYICILYTHTYECSAHVEANVCMAPLIPIVQRLDVSKTIH